MIFKYDNNITTERHRDLRQISYAIIEYMFKITHSTNPISFKPYLNSTAPSTTLWLDAFAPNFLKLIKVSLYTSTRIKSIFISYAVVAMMIFHILYSSTSIIILSNCNICGHFCFLFEYWMLTDFTFIR